MKCMMWLKGNADVCRKVLFACFPGVLVILISLSAGCTREPDNAEASLVTKMTPVKVSTMVVRAERSGRTVSLTGFTEPVRRATPAARVMARVIDAGFQEGERVKAGRVLIRLDTKDLTARRRQARAAVETASTALEVARLNLERMRALQKTGTVSRYQLEAAEVAHAQANAAAAAARSGLDEIEVSLSYSCASAPFSGVIVRKLVEVGNMVSPGQPLFVIEDDSVLRVVAPVGTDLAAGLEPGQKLSVRIQGKDLEATIEGIVSSGSPQAPGQRVQLLADNRDRRFRAGTLAVVEVPGAGSEVPGIAVPKATLIEKGQLNGVYVVTPGSLARLHWVITGDVRGENVSVLSGLREGDRVVLSPDRAGIRDGSPVEAVPR